MSGDTQARPRPRFEPPSRGRSLDPHQTSAGAGAGSVPQQQSPAPAGLRRSQR